MNPLDRTTPHPPSPTRENLLVQAIGEYQIALDHGDPPDRDVFLARHPEIAGELADCLDNIDFLRNIAPQLTDESEGQMAAESRSSVASFVSASPASNLPRLGDFRIVREIGRGGMGVVYEAEQMSMSRRVALKVLPFAAVLDQKVLRRFRSEAQIAGQLVHQNIVPVHAVGSERGVHYYAMQYIDGRTLAELITTLKRPADEGRLPMTIGRFSTGEAEPNQCRKTATKPKSGSQSAIRNAETDDTSPVAALTTARSHGDRAYIRAAAKLAIQAANALDYAHSEGVIHRDIKPSNLMIDSTGKVWVTDFGLAHIEAGPSVTITGDILGTLRYMSPEQALAQRVIVDHRTDIYSLGLTFYELLTQRPAYSGSSRQELLRQISFEEPPRPRRLNRSIPTDLDTIVLKAMEKNPADRYATAGELAKDLQNFIDDRPIKARRPTLAQRGAKWCRRHKVPVATIAAAIFVLFACIASAASLVAVQLSRVAEQEKEIADKERAARRDVERAHQQIALQLAGKYVDHAQMLCERGDVGKGLHWLVRSLDVAPDDDDAVALRRVIRQNLAAWAARLNALEVILPHDQPVTTVEFCYNDSRAFIGCSDGSGRIWDPTAGKLIRGPIEHQSAIRSAAFNARSNTIATGTEQGKVRLIDANTGQSVKEYQVGNAIRALAFSKDGAQILVGTQQGWAAVLEVTTGNVVSELQELPDSIMAVSFSPDGSPLAVESMDHAYQLWNVGKGKASGSTVEHERVIDAVIAPDGVHFATGGLDNRLVLWNSATAKQFGNEMRHHGDIYCVAMSEDGALLASGGSASDALIWDVSTGNPIGHPLRNSSPGSIVRGIAFDHGGNRLLMGCQDGTVSLWRIARARQSTSSIATGTGRIGHYSAVAIDPDGLRVIARGKDGTAQIWDVSTQAPIGKPFDDIGSISAVAFSHDGKRVLLGAYGGELQIWDAITSKQIGDSFQHQKTIRAAAFSPDGSRIATASEDGTARILNAESGKPVGHPLRHQDTVHCVAFSPDGSQILTGCWDNTAQLWDTASQQRLGDPFQHESDVVGVAFSPDGKRVATASTHTCRVWDVATRQVVGTPLQHDGALRAIAFSPDPARPYILTGSLDRTARLWDVETGKPIGPPITHDDSVWHVAFSADGAKLLVAGEGTVRIWPRPPDPVVGVSRRLELWVEVITGMELNKDAGGIFTILGTPTWRDRRRQLHALGGPPAP